MLLREAWHGILTLPQIAAPAYAAPGEKSTLQHSLPLHQQRSFRVRIVTLTQISSSGSSATAKEQAAASAPSSGGLRTVLEADTARVGSHASAAAAGGSIVPPIRRLLLQGEPALAHLLEGYSAMLVQRWQQCADLITFMGELREIITRILRSHTGDAHAAPLLSSPAVLGALLRELPLLPGGGWSCVKEMDSVTARDLTLTLKDPASREHLMRVKLPPDYPHSQPSVQVDLPLPFGAAEAAQAGASTAAAPALSGAVSGVASPLCSLYRRFSVLVASSQLFFDVSDDLSAHAWILEPEAPIPRSVLTRRLALGKACSLDFTLDPLHPLRAPADLRVFGSEVASEPLQQRLDEFLASGEWDSTIPASPSEAASALRRNLLRALGMDALPLPTPDNREEFQLECSVCYTYALDGSIPDFVCPNPQCARPSHSNCLVSWLQAVPSTRTAFQSLYGTCPVCSAQVTVPLHG